MSWKPSNQTTRYDEERVARLRVLDEAVGNLKLPPLRSRKLKGILNALEMQVEDGGDSPEVNQLLLQALRAGVRHQVDEKRARTAFGAIDAFEQSEAKRWEQVKSGTLPPIVVPPIDHLHDLIQDGYRLHQAKQRTAACDRWLEAWEMVKRLKRPGMRTTRVFDEAYPGGLEFVFNWCQDFEMELGNAGWDNPIYHEHRLRYAREFLEQFPDEDDSFQVNFARAQGEALWHLGRRGDAEAVYESLVHRLPDNAWGYIGWADNYWLFNDSPKDYAKGEAILKRGLTRPNLDDRDDVLDRLNQLHEEWNKPTEQATVPTQREAVAARPAPLSSLASATPAAPSRSVEASAPAVKPARNAPCWCGSGRKYKRCHLASDQAASSRR